MPRLKAVAVAPDLTAATIVKALRKRVDAAFMPRPLVLVESLPRNRLGKLLQVDILALLAQNSPK